MVRRWHIGRDALLVGGVALACAPPNAAQSYPSAEPAPGTTAVESAEPSPSAQGTAKYFDRAVELEPFLSGFPYTSFEPSMRTGTLFFLEKGESYRLKALDLRWVLGAAGSGTPYATLDLTAAKTLGNADWSKRSLWSIHPQRGTDTVWLHADARNDERMNLWTLDSNDGSLTQVTDHDYVYGYGFDDADAQLAYLPRKGTKAPFSTCLHVMEVATRQERVVVCDTPELTFTWSRPRFSPDGAELYFNAQTRGDRNRVQLVRVALDVPTPKVELVTDPKIRRNSPSLLEGWVDDDTLLFRANDDGHYNLYRHSRRSRKIRQLTKFDEDLTSARRTDAGVVGVHRTPAGSTLVLIDADTGATKTLARLPGTADVLDAHGSLAIVTQRAPDRVYEAYLARVSSAGFAMSPLVELDEKLEGKLVQCEATAVRIPTFDRDPHTRRPRELHAFLLKPRRPIADAKHRLTLVRSFYGGANTYNTFDQILCAAGLVVVSPAVRGSRGFGREFSALNDRDLGGDEIVDLFHVARWAERQTGLGSERIGVYGRSHGGYATMRALTFPPETNGRDDDYRFGFGLADAGFSDIKAFYDATNIPDWVVLESGDPNNPKDLARMKDRSPLSHVARLSAPILLTHGSNDWRVPVDGSRAFAEEAKRLGKPVTYVEFEGQGHHVEGVARQREAWQVRFDFLMRVAEAAAAAAPP